jgi:hypothetical protein
MRNLKILAFFAVALISTGCLRVTHTLNLKADGTGTISSTAAVSQQFMQQAGAMMAQGGSLIPNEAAMRASAKNLGPGVRFVSSTPYKAAGFEGITAVYAFDDVSKLSWNMEQAMTGAINLPGQDPNDKPDPEAAIRLSLARGATGSTLVIGMPKIPDVDPEQKTAAQQQAQQAQSNPQVEAMMKQMLQGMLMEVSINIDGKIVKTNAPYVEGSRVVLMRMDGDQLLKSGAGASQLLKISQNGDVKKMLSQVPGLKIVLAPEVRVEFR